MTLEEANKKNEVCNEPSRYLKDNGFNVIEDTEEDSDKNKYTKLLRLYYDRTGLNSECFKQEDTDFAIEVKKSIERYLNKFSNKEVTSFDDFLQTDEIVLNLIESKKYTTDWKQEYYNFVREHSDTEHNTEESNTTQEKEYITLNLILRIIEIPALVIILLLCNQYVVNDTSLVIKLLALFGVIISALELIQSIKDIVRHFVDKK
jgi:hypothetical protein